MKKETSAVFYLRYVLALKFGSGQSLVASFLLRSPSVHLHKRRAALQTESEEHSLVWRAKESIDEAFS